MYVTLLGDRLQGRSLDVRLMGQKYRNKVPYIDIE
jgi:hypothetical protein